MWVVPAYLGSTADIYVQRIWTCFHKEGAVEQQTAAREGFKRAGKYWERGCTRISRSGRRGQNSTVYRKKQERRIKTGKRWGRQEQT